MILALLAIFAADLPATVATPPAARIVLSEGTRVQLATVDPLDSRTVKQGQRFALQVVEDVMVGSVVAIPRGTAAVGEVEAVSAKGMVGKAGELVFQPLFVDIAGQRINLIGAQEARGKDSTTGVAVGSLLITGFGLFITGKSASVPAGSLLAGQVRSDTTLANCCSEPAAPEASAPTSPGE